MDENPEGAAEGLEKPEVYRIAQLPVRGRPGMDRRTFVKATVAGVGAAAVMSVAGGCTGDDEPCTCESDTTDCTTDTGGICTCDEVCTCEAVCSCDGDCACDSVCTCEAVCSCENDCTCDTVGSHYWYPC